MRYTSRKFIVAALSVVAGVLIPMLNKYMQISDAITLSELGYLFAVGAGYGGLNILEKRITNDTGTN